MKTKLVKGSLEKLMKNPDFKKVYEERKQMNNLLNQKGIQVWKPHRYPEAYQRYLQHNQAFWTKDLVPLSKDIQDWNELSVENKEFLRYLFLLFTQNDVCVGAGYDVLLRCFKPTEVQMMLRNQADRENIHIDAYSYLLDTLGFDDSIYAEFQEFECMDKKLEFVENAKIKKYEEYEREVREEWDVERFDFPEINKRINFKYRSDLAYMLAVYAGCTEGVSLFAQFALLLSYQLKNLMPGMCQIVTWSIRDEEMHVVNNSWLFRKLIEENPDIWTDDLKRKIYSAFREIVEKEKAYLDFIYAKGVTPMVTKDEMYSYLEYIADRRLLELGMKANFGVTKNPLPFMEELTSLKEFANFFETQSTEYGFGATQGTWDEVRKNLSM